MDALGLELRLLRFLRSQAAVWLVLGLFLVQPLPAVQKGEAESLGDAILNPETILVKNVRLINREGQTDDQLVNILIKKTLLDIVTRDTIDEKDDMLVLDAGNGILLGNLDIGRPAAFMIIDQDPRENLKVLLDTKAHILIALYEGKILVNNLETPSAADLKTSQKKARKWFSYTPPPVSLPVSYRNTRKWNRWDTRYVSGTLLGAAMLDRQIWISQDTASKEQVGNLEDYDGGELRGFRIGAVGTFKFKRPWIYTFFAATRAFDKGFDAENDGSLILYDWRLDIPLTDKVSLAAGKQKEPISQERIMSLAYWPILERSAAADAFLPSRNIGLTLSGTVLDQRMTWAGGVFNDWFDTGQRFDESSSQLIGRVTGVPLVNENNSNLLHLGFGVRYSDAKGGLRYRTEPEFDQSPLFTDTGHLPPIIR
jgi:phosphate-selective porin OprO/OprP